MDSLQSVKQRFGIIGNNIGLNRALEKSLRVSNTDISVLVIGESGVGKEAIPKIIHQLSHRKHGKYIAVNCGAIPEGTIDSELFGHEKGAFTGATQTRSGYFEVADGGTIFLDEVGELPMTTQVRLLRVLENGEFIKVGSSKVQKTNVRIVAGQDRVKEFDKLAQNYNGQLYQFDAMEVISSGDRDPDAEGMEGLSSSRMRLAAAEGDFKTFRAGLPDGIPRKSAMELFDTVRQTMNVKEMKEFWNIWEIAPKYDLENLRESYVAKKIFNIGDKVENLNTGMIGRIIRRGANHLICVAENNIMFKSWVKDLREAIVNATTPSGVPADQRLVGTDAHRKYTETMVPGSSYGLHFINKYKKRK